MSADVDYRKKYEDTVERLLDTLDELSEVTTRLHHERHRAEKLLETLNLIGDVDRSMIFPGPEIIAREARAAIDRYVGRPKTCEVSGIEVPSCVHPRKDIVHGKYFCHDCKKELIPTYVEREPDVAEKMGVDGLGFDK